ncbi:hypothetical protein [Endozoicomonas sp. 8E]|uniref:hypothetical protein n=1 Tax=Endozoicomonas sp. 8E TaxID=3035692 RepID=UPI002939501B|nr:hypothetical protein [Endozoicomonas sp. 8E]WOG25879.1 hypothetical protein P6910_15000 [Endozoicomonas sp. 8E]
MFSTKVATLSLLFFGCSAFSSEPFFMGEWQGHQENTDFFCNILFTFQSKLEYSQDHYFYVPLSEGIIVEKFRSGDYGQYSLMIYDKANKKIIDYQYYKLWFYIDAIDRKDKISTQKILLLTDLNDSKEFDNKDLPTKVLTAAYNLNIQPTINETYSIGMIEYKNRIFKSCTVTKKNDPFTDEL